MGLLDLASCTPRFRSLIGTGGIGHGSFFLLEGNDTLGREESRSGRFLDRRDSCKLHIVSHHVKALLGGMMDVYPIGRVGNDADGRRLIREMTDVGLDMRFVKFASGRPTLFSFCLVYPDGSGGNLTSNDSASGAVDAQVVQEAEAVLQAAGKGGIALAVPEVPLQARRALLELASRCGLFRAAGFTRAEMGDVRSAGLFEHVDLCAVNLEEAAAAAGVRDSRVKASEPFRIAHRVAEELAREFPKLQLSITGGSTGSWSWDGESLAFDPAVPVRAAGTAGAGDAHFAGILAGLSAGLALRDAQQLGTIVAGASVTSPHTIHPAMTTELLRSVCAARVQTAAPVRALLDNPNGGP
ncbi:MAG: carbohydrate kinase family protein [Spirochaetia bacterium]